jgi:hypothetical protein
MNTVEEIENKINKLSLSLLVELDNYLDYLLLRLYAKRY